jgi:hypothetical protein
MAKVNVVYEEESTLIAKYSHQKSGEYVDYKAKVVIKDSGKTPVQMKLKFDGIYPGFAPMPPEDHAIKAGNILELAGKLTRWLKKYGYEQV